MRLKNIVLQTRSKTVMNGFTKDREPLGNNFGAKASLFYDKILTNLLCVKCEFPCLKSTNSFEVPGYTIQPLNVFTRKNFQEYGSQGFMISFKNSQCFIIYNKCAKKIHV